MFICGNGVLVGVFHLDEKSFVFLLSLMENDSAAASELSSGEDVMPAPLQISRSEEGTLHSRLVCISSSFKKKIFFFFGWS